MSISASLLPEFDHEMATARKVLERVPDDKFDWAPHATSMKLGHLAGHIAEMPAWAAVGITQDSLDLAGYKPAATTTTAQVLEAFDKNIASARAAIAGASDETFFKTWSLQRDGQTLMSMPKMVVVRSFMLNHVIHHRGQLSVYLRILGVKIPSIYGPSGDEGSMG